jgi:KaiC/GvpD/RAD55 family RecA-like ATPase
LRDLGLSQEQAGLALHFWNDQQVRHPRPAEDIEKAVSNAYRYARDEAGNSAPPPAAEAFAGLLSAPEPPPATPTEAATRAARDGGLRLRFRSLEEAADEPLPAWLVEGAILASGMTVLYGPPKRGKTFAALDLALAVASGRKWFNVIPVHADGPVVYVALEGYAEVVARALAWQAARGEVPRGRFILVDGRFAAGDPAQAEALLTAIKAAVPRPALLVVDTFARASVGLDENKAADVAVLADHLEGMGEALACPVLVIHHAGKNEEAGPRGSTALLAAAGSLLSAHIQDGRLRVKVVETRRGMPGLEIVCRVVNTGEHPVWDAEERPEGGAGLTQQQKDVLTETTFLRAVLRTACCGADGETISRTDFIGRLGARLRLPPAEAMRRLDLLVDRNPELRRLLVMGATRIAVYPADGYDALLSQVRRIP